MNVMGSRATSTILDLGGIRRKRLYTSGEINLPKVLEVRFLLSGELHSYHSQSMATMENQGMKGDELKSVT